MLITNENKHEFLLDSRPNRPPTIYTESKVRASLPHVIKQLKEKPKSQVLLEHVAKIAKALPEVFLESGGAFRLVRNKAWMTSVRPTSCVNYLLRHFSTSNPFCYSIMHSAAKIIDKRKNGYKATVAKSGRVVVNADARLFFSIGLDGKKLARSFPFGWDVLSIELLVVAIARCLYCVWGANSDREFRQFIKYRDETYDLEDSAVSIVLDWFAAMSAGLKVEHTFAEDFLEMHCKRFPAMLLRVRSDVLELYLARAFRLLDVECEQLGVQAIDFDTCDIRILNLIATQLPHRVKDFSRCGEMNEDAINALVQCDFDNAYKISEVACAE